VTLTADNAAIVYDSTADLPEGPARHANWRMVPLAVRFGDEELRDHVDLTPAQFYARLERSAEVPTTAAPGPGAFADAYAELLDRYEHVFSIHLSGKLSSTVESARIAAQEFGDRVDVVDSNGVSVPTGLAVIGVQALLVHGTRREDVLDFLARHAREVRCFFSLDTLEYLQRGGRIGKAQAFVGQLLAVHPILALEDGELRPLRRVRGRGKVVAGLVEEMQRALGPTGSAAVMVGHASAPEKAAELVRAIEAARPGVAIDGVVEIGAVVGTHAGPGALGLAFSTALPEASGM
jgi:DegV family protein with EDD domain